MGKDGGQAFSGSGRHRLPSSFSFSDRWEGWLKAGRMVTPAACRPPGRRSPLFAGDGPATLHANAAAFSGFGRLRLPGHCRRPYTLKAEMYLDEDMPASFPLPLLSLSLWAGHASHALTNCLLAPSSSHYHKATEGHWMEGQCLNDVPHFFPLSLIPITGSSLHHSLWLAGIGDYPLPCHCPFLPLPMALPNTTGLHNGIGYYQWIEIEEQASFLFHDV